MNNGSKGKKSPMLSVVMPVGGFTYIYNGKEQFVSDCGFSLSIKPGDTFCVGDKANILKVEVMQ